MQMHLKAIFDQSRGHENPGMRSLKSKLDVNYPKVCIYITSEIQNNYYYIILYYVKCININTQMSASHINVALLNIYYVEKTSDIYTLDCQINV